MGWERDPYGIHELRYFSQGNPTKLVKDGEVESYDDPPAGPTGLGSDGRHTSVPTMEPQAATSAAPPGWYPNPSNPEQARYWDGAAWASEASLPTPSGEVPWAASEPQPRPTPVSSWSQTRSPTEQVPITPANAAPGGPASTPASAADGLQKLADLRSLTDLRSHGVLTDLEFELLKARLLQQSEAPRQRHEHSPPAAHDVAVPPASTPGRSVPPAP